jgi:hypothetical protein
MKLLLMGVLLTVAGYIWSLRIGYPSWIMVIGATVVLVEALKLKRANNDASR